MQQRMRFIADVLREEESVSALCRRYGVSRQTGHMWIRRYLEGGPTGLTDKSRAAVARPNATPPAVVELVVGTREKHPTWGPKKHRHGHLSRLRRTRLAGRRCEILLACDTR